MPERKNNKIEMGGIDLNPGDRIGVYRYERPIGKGGMAEVLLAYDPNDQPMALKVLKASRFRTGRRRFRREFRALAKLRRRGRSCAWWNRIPTGGQGCTRLSCASPVAGGCRSAHRPRRRGQAEGARHASLRWPP